MTWRALICRLFGHKPKTETMTHYWTAGNPRWLKRMDKPVNRTFCARCDIDLEAAPGDIREDGAILTAMGWMGGGEIWIRLSRLETAKAHGWKEIRRNWDMVMVWRQ